MRLRCIHGNPSVLPDHSLCCKASAILGSGDLFLDVVAEIVECLHIRHLFGLDLEAKLLLDDDHDVDEIEAVDADVFLQTGFRLDLFFINLKVLDEELFDSISCLSIYVVDC